jgi:hypothetical protein
MSLPRAAWRIAAILVLFPVTSLSQVRTPLELHAYRDYAGPAQRIAIDPSGQVSWLATPSTLYELREGAPKVVDAGPGGGAQLLLAPGGGLHAWMIPGQAPKGLFTVRLMASPARRVADLHLEKFPFGFGALYLGAGGKLVVTASPLDDWQGLSGRFLYVFWSVEGRRLADMILDGPRIGVVDPAGTAIVLLGKAEAVAFGARGQELWRRKGHYRKAALGAGGMLALLNPAGRELLGEVHVVRGDKDTVVRIPTPVHDLALSPDGALGALVGDRGRYFLLSVDSAKVREAQRLPVDGAFYITAARFIDAKILVLGVAQRDEKAPSRGFARGAVLAVGVDGQVLLQRSLRIEDSTFSPFLEVTPGSRTFAAFTPQRTLVLSVGDK